MTVLSIRSLSTVPTRTLRLPRSPVFSISAMSQLPLAQDRLHARDVAPQSFDQRRTLQLLGRTPETQPEQLFARLRNLLEDFVVAEIADVGGVHAFPPSLTAPWRTTNLLFTGSFAAASAIACFARSSVTPSISNSTRPGFTTATHSSGLPLPLPIRVSAGFFVTGLSGNTRIQTLPPRLRLRVSATRAASI